jgi:hypothetical protein
MTRFNKEIIMTPVWPRLVRDLPGLRVRVIRPVTNGFMTIPTGANGTIKRATAWNRIEFRAEPCLHCGVIMHISGLSKGDLEVRES